MNRLWTIRMLHTQLTQLLLSLVTCWVRGPQGVGAMYCVQASMVVVLAALRVILS